MLAPERAEREGALDASFCWSCGVSDSGGDPCLVCGASARPTVLPRSKLIGATASLRRTLRNRFGLVVGESQTSVLLALPDATLTEASSTKLTSISGPSDGCRSSAWALVSASRAIKPTDQAKFDELITSFVLELVDRSVDEARGFALDALTADCPGWLDKIHLTTTERDFLFASYHADRGNTAIALERLLRLPADRYPTKDLVFLRCLGAIKEDSSSHEGVLEHLRPFGERPIAQCLLSVLAGGTDLGTPWLRAGGIVLQRAAPSEDIGFPRALAEGFLGAIRDGLPLPAGTRELGPEARIFALTQAARADGPTPPVSLRDLQDAPESLLDDAIENGLLDVEPSERQHPLAKYVMARTDPERLSHDDLAALNYETELARRALLRGDRATLASLPSSPSTDQLKALDCLRFGEVQAALEQSSSFEGQNRSKVENVALCLDRGSIEYASNEVLTDGTIWPILAPLLPEDASALNGMTTERPALRGVAAWRALSGALSRLWDWDWEGAVVEAKRCLLVARDEQTRDEALNLIACAEWLAGDDTDAIAALVSALEGSYTEGLQINIGVVASSLDPQLAGEHLGKLALKAPTTRLRVAAATRALELWYADPEPWDTAEGEHALPAELRDGLRNLVRSDIAEDAFVRFMRTMSRWDEEWLSAEDSLSGSSFESSAAASVYRAKAQDFESFVKALAGVVARDDAPEWATEERDGLVGAAIAALDPSDPNPMAASFGLVLIDNGLPMDADVYIELVAFTIVVLCQGIDPEEGEPKERFLDLVAQARENVAEVPKDGQERSISVLDVAASTVARSIAAARAYQYDQVVDLYNDLARRLYGVPGYRINRAAVRSGTQTAVDFLSDTVRLLDRLIALVTDAEFHQQLTEFRDQVRSLLTAFDRVRGT